MASLLLRAGGKKVIALSIEFSEKLLYKIKIKNKNLIYLLESGVVVAKLG